MKKIADILVVLICLLVAFYFLTTRNNPLGIRSYVVLSGSMEPAVRTGSLVLAHSENNYYAGDIISFRNSNQVITHRIQKVTEISSGRVYLTKGDANQTNDSGKVSGTDVIGKVVFTVPFIGYFLSFIKTIPGLFVFILIPALLIVFLELKKIFFENEPNAKDKMQGIKKTMHISLSYFFIIGASAMVVGAPAAYAYFSSLQTITGNTVITPISTITPTPTPTTANHIVISEIQIHGNNANQDFVEFYNPTLSDIDISGWKLRKKDAAGTDSSLVLIGTNKTIKAHGFFLWANSQSGYATSLGADESTTANISVNNSVLLKKANDEIVDQVAWGSGSNQYVEGTPVPNYNPSSPQSIERKAYSASTVTSMMPGGADADKGNGYDSNNNINDFILRTVSQPQNSLSTIEIP